MIAFLAGFEFGVIVALCWLLLRAQGNCPPAAWLALQKKGWWRK